MKNYSDGKNLVQSSSHGVKLALAAIPAIFDTGNASYILLKKKKKASFIPADMVSVTWAVIGLRHI